MKRKGKSKDSEIFKKKLKTDKQKLMPSVPSVLLKNPKDLPETKKEKNLSTSRESSKTWNKLEPNNSQTKNEDLQNKLSKSVMNF